MPNTNQGLFSNAFESINILVEQLERIKKERNDAMEIAIEFAWQMGHDSNSSRAEYRHLILKEIEHFMERHDMSNEDDIDEYIEKYLREENIR